MLEFPHRPISVRKEEDLLVHLQYLRAKHAEGGLLFGLTLASTKPRTLDRDVSEERSENLLAMPFETLDFAARRAVPVSLEIGRG